jgi:alpha-tubulin suppressor-like RCC1 family protein
LGQPELAKAGAGHLGDAPDEVGALLPPIRLGSGLEPRVVAAGMLHTCVILSNGRVKCWGYNLHGQLGIGSDAPSVDGMDQLGDALPFAMIE